MSWLVLFVLTAGPLDDVEPLHVGPARTPATATQKTEHAGTKCTFTRREVNDARVAWQWVANCPVEDLRVESDGAQVGVRLFTQQSHWTLLVLDGARAIDVQEVPGMNAPAWVSRALLAKLKTQYEGLSSVLARDPRDGALATQAWDRGYERVTPSSAPEGPQRAPLFERSPPPNTPVRALWFVKGAKEPWVLFADDPWRRVEFSLRAPGGETRQLFTRPAREQGGSYRIEDLTHVTAKQGEVFSARVDWRHLILWPRPDGSFLPRVGGVALTAQTPPLAVASVPPCNEKTDTRVEESVNAPRLFSRNGTAWAAWLTTTSTTRWHVGPVLKLGAKEERACEWILDGRQDHFTVTVGRFTEQGQLEEQLRIPVDGVPSRLQLTESPDGVTLAAASMGRVTVTRIKP